ncbi:aqualysin-1-like [Diadema setosum]|uniref:aqualysin-1-like n=1 Tax=Diadema setosum TaxID=31175 RepID=UPI003B3AE2E8
MRQLLFLALVGVSLQLVASRQALAPFYRSDDAIEGSYIVVLKKEVDNDVVSNSLVQRANADGIKMVIKKRLRHLINAFVAEFPSKALQLVRSHDAVRYVEEDGMVYATETTWGLDRIDQADLPLDDSYTPIGDGGAGVNVYVLDTGIRTTHEEFEDRAFIAYDAMEYAIGADGDCQGHGTHCASTVAGKVYGVAPKAHVHSVRVLGCSGSGSKGGVMEGMEWVAISGQRPAIASMSLGGSGSYAEDEVLTLMDQMGVLVVVAAGNSDYESCRRSPARSREALTVGASEIDDERAYFSNWGGCVDIFAPGRYITAASWLGDDLYRTISGTSMATPHVAGVAAVHLGMDPSRTPADLRDIIMNTAARDKVQDPNGAPNLLLQIPKQQ